MDNLRHYIDKANVALLEMQKINGGQFTETSISLSFSVKIKLHVSMFMEMTRNSHIFKKWIYHRH